MPILVRGIDDEGWTPSATPKRLRTQEEFLGLVEERYGHREPVAYEELVRAVFATLDEFVTAEQVEKVRDALGDELAELWPPPAEA